MGWETSFLGYPITDESITPDGIGRYNHFRKTDSSGTRDGSIYWTPSTGAHETHGVIRDKWASLGWETSSLGYPISDVEETTISVIFFTTKGLRQTFQHGTISWNPINGTTVGP
jgi:uncharacterized protein with LGFP repeats